MVFPNDHLYEWEFNELAEFLEDENFEIKHVFGCFGKKQETMQALDEMEKELYERLEPYYSWHVLSPFFATLHPQAAQGAIWLCQKQYN
jgi:hypothetical protein